jgi:hypothetical protein
MSFKNYLLLKLKVSFFQLGFFLKKWKIIIKRKISLLFSLLSFFQQFIDIELSLTYRWTFISGLLKESYKMVKHAKQFLCLYLKVFILNTKKTSWDVFLCHNVFFLYYLPIVNLSRCICPKKKSWARVIVVYVIMLLKGYRTVEFGDNPSIFDNIQSKPSLYGISISIHLVSTDALMWLISQTHFRYISF